MIKSVEIEVEAALEKLKAAKKDESAKIKALAKNVEQDTTKLHDYTGNKLAHGERGIASCQVLSGIESCQYYSCW